MARNKVSELSPEELIRQREMVRNNVKAFRQKRRAAKLLAMGSCPTCKRPFDSLPDAPSPREAAQS